MGLVYFKRFRMEMDLLTQRLDPPELDGRYTLSPWRPALLEHHAEAKLASFCEELDANVFPCLGSRDGCRRLMAEISKKSGFLPSATWLLRYSEEPRSGETYVGTIQGIVERGDCGGVQNLGVAPPHRGRGLAKALLARSVEGFRSAGLKRVCLEVTSQNQSAIRLYERLGFRHVKTVYKAVEVAYA